MKPIPLAPVKKFHIKPEDKTQMAILDFCRLVYPQLYECRLKIHNEGQRAKSTNKFLQRLGFRTGASDLFFAYPTRQYPGLWMEIKRDGWKLTKAQEEHVDRQKAFLAQQERNGYMAKFVVGIEEGIAALHEYMRSELRR